jgi:hypothetical protein
LHCWHNLQAPAINDIAPITALITFENFLEFFRGGAQGSQFSSVLGALSVAIVFSTSIADTRFNNAIQMRTCQRRAAAYCCCVDTAVAHRATAGDCAARCLRKLAGHKFGFAGTVCHPAVACSTAVFAAATGSPSQVMHASPQPASMTSKPFSRP